MSAPLDDFAEFLALSYAVVLTSLAAAGFEARIVRSESGFYFLHVLEGSTRAEANVSADQGTLPDVVADVAAWTIEPVGTPTRVVTVHQIRDGDVEESTRLLIEAVTVALPATGDERP